MKKHEKIILVITLLGALVLYIHISLEPPFAFTVKKESMERFEFFSNYVHYFGSNYSLDGVKHVMIARTGAVEVSLKKDGRFIVYCIAESEVFTKNEKDTAFVRMDYERLYSDLLLQMKK